MDTERIRPSVYVSYDVDFRAQEHALEYSNLGFRYIEETVEERGRGYAVIAKSVPQQFRITERFGAMNIYFPRLSPRQFELEVGLDHTVMSNYGVSTYRALPYGCLPIDAATADKFKTTGALIGYLQRRLLHNFEVDAIRAVIGDFKTAEEIQSSKEEIVVTLREWREMRPQTFFGEAVSEPPMNRKGVPILSSPVIRDALCG